MSLGEIFLNSPATMIQAGKLHEVSINIWTAKREYDHYFISPIAYVVAFMILLTIESFSP
jgi:hypothetical protein